MPESSPLLRAAWRHPYALAAGTAIAVGVLTLLVATAADLPLRDPDGLFGPSYVRLPVIGALALAVDVVPRALWRTRSLRRLPAGTVAVVRERWPWRRLAVASVGLASFYLTYVAYRNLKSFLPFLRDDLYDVELGRTDLLVAGGIHPAEVLHQLLGTTTAAEVLSSAYLAFLFLVPVSLAVALVWADDVRRGAWYVTALCLNWVLGTASYYLLPSLGPAYAQPWHFDGLERTGTTGLQEALLSNRFEVLADPHATGSVHGIAAFASLHVSIVFTAALVAHLLRLPALVRLPLWGFFVLTAVATVYFGWHYVVDDVAGVGIGAASVAIAGYATGQWPRRAAARATAPAAATRRGADGAVGMPVGDRVAERERASAT